jgi:hypothetical protein
MRGLLVREVFETLRAALRYGTFAFLAYCAWRSISALAGRATGADLKLAVTTAIQVGKQEWVPWLVTILLAVWALSERVLRLRRTDSLSERIADLEYRLESGAAQKSVGRERRSTGG